MKMAFRQHHGGAFTIGHTMQRCTAHLLRALKVLFLGCFIFSLANGTPPGNVFANGLNDVYLPTISRTGEIIRRPIIHIPFLNATNILETHYNQMALFWFGKVSPTDNYTHVRTGYNQAQLSMEVSIYDRDLWYDDAFPTANEVTQWDAVSMYFYLPQTPQRMSHLFRFDAQLSHWQTRQPYQAAFERIGTGWKLLNMPFSTKAIYRGEGINGSAEDKGWMLEVNIPFASVGYSSNPGNLEEWRMGLRVYDQDIGPGKPGRSQVWPTGFSESNTESFGIITFGYPSFSQPGKPVAGRTEIQQSPSVFVPDGSVGGHTNCGGSANYWSEWGELVYDDAKTSEQVVVQNQRDVSDFPCFSRYYVTFPINSIPPGKVILSAKLVLHQFGNSDPTQAYSSYIQVFRVIESCKENTLSWNNSPQVYENYHGSWVDPLATYPGVPGVERTWDVAQALIATISEGQPSLNLVLQSADSARHSGKYFWSSETAEWNSSTPPKLNVTWANP